MSAARRPDSHPLRFPMGVRTASMITGCAMTDLPPANPGLGPAAPLGRNLEPVLTLAPAPRSLPVPGHRAPTTSRRTLEVLQCLPGDYDTLDLVRPFVDLGHLRVAHHALDGEVLRIAVPAEELYRVERDGHGRIGRKGLRHGAELRE